MHASSFVRLGLKMLIHPLGKFVHLMKRGMETIGFVVLVSVLTGWKEGW